MFGKDPTCTKILSLSAHSTHSPNSYSKKFYLSTVSILNTGLERGEKYHNI